MLLGVDALGRLALGQEINTQFNWLSAAAGSFTLSGQAATFQDQFVAAQGAFTLTGEAALFQERLAAPSGSFAETGFAAPLQQQLGASFGSFAWTGYAIVNPYTENAGGGLFTLTGEAATFQIQEAAGVGAFALTGEPAGSHLEIAGGSSSSAQRFDLIPYEVPAKRKPFRPVWDRGGEIEQHPGALGTPLPPGGIFTPGAPPPELFATGQGQAPLTLPGFDHLVPGDTEGLSRTLRDALDHGDAQAALAAYAQRQPQPAPPQPAPVAAPAPAPIARPAPPRFMIPPPPVGAPPDQHLRDANDIRDMMTALRNHAGPGEDQDMADAIAALSAAGLIGPQGNGQQSLPAGLG